MGILDSDRCRIVPAAAPDWHALRRTFAVLSNRAYLDTAYHGPVSTTTTAAVLQYYENWSNQLGSLAGNDWAQAVRDCRRVVAEYLNAADDGEIGLMPSTSHAMTCAALLFGGKGSVVIARGEHPTVIVPWLARNYTLHFAEPDANGDFTAECYARALRKDTKAIAVSHVRYNDGRLNDISGLASLARTSGIHLVVDAIQSIGIVPLDVRVGIDVAGFAGFKWLNAGHGSGALYVRHALLEQYGMPIGGNCSRRISDLREISSFDPALEARSFELGSANVPGALALRASLLRLKELGSVSVLARINHLGARLRGGIRNGVGRIETEGSDQVSPHIIPVVVSDPGRAEEQLSRRGVKVSARGRALRVSVSWYNDESDIDRFLAALDECG